MTLTTFGLYMYGIKGLGAGRASIITFLEPLAATVVGLAVYGEAVTASIVAGMSLVLVSLVLISRDNDPRAQAL
jgi:drug/metabolite transporter (DMT)-like permease